MNNLLDLIQGADVEWKPLGEILVRTKGTKITAKQMKEVDKSNGPVKIFAGGKTVAFVNFDDIPEKDILTETSIIVKSRGIIEFEYYDKPFSHKAEMWSYHSEDENIDIKYVYYFLKMNEKYFQNLGSKMQMPQIATPDTDKYKIPIPSLEIQQKCVEILDKMTDYVTELTAELTAELTLRQKQYSFYRDKLLTFPGGQSDSDESLAVRWTTLGEVATILAGGDLPEKYNKGQKEPSEEFPYPIYSNGTGDQSLYGFANSYRIDDEAVTISARGTLGWHTIRSAKFTPIVRLLTLIPDKEIISTKFLNYILTQAELGGVQTGIPSLTKPMVEKVKIAIPPLNLQSKIVEILDKFQALTEDVSGLLPEEIALRQKQYAYYREQLLTFTANSGKASQPASQPAIN